MREIQFENRFPDTLAVPNLYLNMRDDIHTPNDNVLRVLTDESRVTIADYSLAAPGGLPMYMFGAYLERPGLLRAVVRARAPGDYPHRRHPDIRPTEQMGQIIEYLDSVDNPVAAFRVNWTADNPLYDTNAMLFRRYMDDPAYSQLSVTQRQEAAALRTPTGRMMTRLGFIFDAESVFDYGNVIEADFLRHESVEPQMPGSIYS